MNPYLKRLREQYEALRSSIEGLQTRAAEGGRDLTEDELRSITDQAKQAETLHAQIKDLTDIEVRNRSVADLSTRIAESIANKDEADNGGGEQTRSGQSLGTSSTTTRDRDPGHYTRSSSNSFFRDLHLSRTHSDEDAQRRLVEHNRALSTGSQGPGIVPPHWLTEEFAELSRQGRALANAVRNIPLGDDPRPLTLPKQIAGVTGSTVAEQATENTALASVDEWDSDVDTVTPRPTAGKQTVSRQMLDMSTPAVDQLIYSDLLSEFNRQVESKVGTAIKAAGVALTAIASESAFDTNQAGADSVIDLAMGVRTARRLPANILAMTIPRYGEFLKLKGTDGRPLIAEETAGGAMNVIGVGTVNVDGRVRGLGIIATEGMGTGTYPDTYAAFRASDTLLFESSLLRFRFEEVSGPQSIVLGVWGYTAVLVRYAADSVRKINVTIA